MKNKPLPEDTKRTLDLIKAKYKWHLMYGSYIYGGYDYKDVDIVLFSCGKGYVGNMLQCNGIGIAPGAPGSFGTIHTTDSIPVNIICFPKEAYDSCKIATDFLQLLEPILDKDKRYGAFLTVMGLVKASGFRPVSGSFNDVDWDKLHKEEDRRIAGFGPTEEPINKDGLEELMLSTEVDDDVFGEWAPNES